MLLRHECGALLAPCLATTNRSNACVWVQGMISLKTNKGSFQDKYKLEFWVYVGVTGWEGTAAKVPDIQVSIRGDNGQCNVIKIYDVKPDAFEPICNYCAGEVTVASGDSACSATVLGSKRGSSDMRLWTLVEHTQSRSQGHGQALLLALWQRSPAAR
eukprot:GHUV01026957.1.p2 GENE.GHUV01026957.1~~GHUV01026957.1.p2  ORF type:complete len:158 (-),score=33.50 GHUV01026957.1:737-1210(-)